MSFPFFLSVTALSEGRGYYTNSILNVRNLVDFIKSKSSQAVYMFLQRAVLSRVSWVHLSVRLSHGLCFHLCLIFNGLILENVMLRSIKSLAQWSTFFHEHIPRDLVFWNHPCQFFYCAVVAFVTLDCYDLAEGSFVLKIGGDTHRHV